MINLKNRNVLLPLFSLIVFLLSEMSIANENEEAGSKRPAGNSIEEVVVTAQHRTQTLRDVPLSISVLSGDEIRKAGIMTFDDVARMTPNVSIATEDQSVYIRGFGSGNNALVEPSVGFSIDGIPYARSGYIRDGFLDVARVEVLRGPQGTLFGKNAVAGAINVVTADPSDDFGAQVNAAGGDYNQHQVDVAAWGPMFMDGLSGRLAIASHRMGNYIENTTQNKGEGSNLTEGARLKIRYEAIPDLSVTASLQLNDQRGRGPSTEYSHLTEEARQALQVFDPTVEDKLDYRGQGNQDSSRNREGKTSYIKIEYSIGEWLIASLTGKAESDDFFQLDGDFSGAPIIYGQRFEDYTQYNQEFKVVSPPGRLEFVGGIFYYKSIVDGGNAGFGFSGLSENPPSGNLYSNFLLINPLELVEPEVTYADFLQETEAYALFGQASYQLFDWMKIELGLRGNRETKSIDFQKTLSETSVVLRAAGSEEFDYRDEREEVDWTPKVSLLFDFSDLYTVYLTWAEGVKAGGYSDAAQNRETITFEPEYSKTWEVGIKGALFDNQLRYNVGAFYTDFDNLQVTNFNGTFYVVSNAASATAKGAEADFTYSPFSWLNIMGAIGYNDAAYNAYPTAPCPATSANDQVSQLQSGAGNDDACDLSGGSLTKAPQWNASLGLQLSVPLDFLGASIALAPTYTWQDDMYLSTDLDPLDMQEAYGLLGINLSVSDFDEVWMFSVNVTNYNDQYYRTDSFDVPLMGGSHAGFSGVPRRILTSFSMRF